MGWRDSELLQGISDRDAALSYRLLLLYFLFAISVHSLQLFQPHFLPVWFRTFGFQFFLLSILVFLYWRGWRPRLELGVRPALCFVGLVGLYFGALFLLDRWAAAQAGPVAESLYQGSTASIFILQILVAPVLEELFFRDYLTRSFYLGMRRWLYAGLFSSAFFMLAHFSFYPGAFLLGLINVFLFVRLKSVLPCIGFHMISNLSWYFLPALYPALFKFLVDQNWLSLFFR